MKLELGDVENRKDGEYIRDRGYIDIPSYVFKDRTLSVLEVMVEYLRDNKKMRFHEIALIINRNDRTVWTVYRRAKLKRNGIIKRNPDEQ
jgi:hypothetical protein